MRRKGEIPAHSWSIWKTFGFDSPLVTTTRAEAKEATYLLSLCAGLATQLAFDGSVTGQIKTSHLWALQNQPV